MEGIVLDVAFAGDRIVHVRPRPTVILGVVQPDRIEPDAGAGVVLERTQAAGGALDREADG